MNWLNLELTTLRSERFLGSEPVERATWLCLMAYCADQENGGVFESCGEWGDRKWMQLVGVTAKEVRAPSDLWSWDGHTLIVWGYPEKKQAEVQRLRDQARNAAAKRWGNAKPMPQGMPAGIQKGNGVGNAELELELEVEVEGNKKKKRRIEYNPQFDALWKLYGLKGNKKPAYAEWQKLDEADKDAAAEGIAPYLQETPNRTLRKDMERYFSNRVWEGVLERKREGCLNIPQRPNEFGTPEPQEERDYSL